MCRKRLAIQDFLVAISIKEVFLQRVCFRFLIGPNGRGVECIKLYCSFINLFSRPQQWPFSIPQVREPPRVERGFEEIEGCKKRPRKNGDMYTAEGKKGIS